MAEIGYYILFDNYHQALSLREKLLEEGIDNRIAPAPYSLLGKVSCGISLLLDEDAINRAKVYLEENPVEYNSIASLENPIQEKRDRYC